MIYLSKCYIVIILNCALVNIICDILQEKSKYFCASYFNIYLYHIKILSNFYLLKRFCKSRVDRCNIAIYYLHLFPFEHNANWSHLMLVNYCKSNSKTCLKLYYFFTLMKNCCIVELKQPGIVYLNIILQEIDWCDKDT